MTCRLHVRENLATGLTARALVTHYVTHVHPLALAHGAPCHLKVIDAWERLAQGGPLASVRFPVVLLHARPLVALEVFEVLDCQIPRRADLVGLGVLPRLGGVFNQPMFAPGDEASDQLAPSSQHPR